MKHFVEIGSGMARGIFPRTVIKIFDRKLKFKFEVVFGLKVPAVVESDFFNRTKWKVWEVVCEPRKKELLKRFKSF